MNTKKLLQIGPLPRGLEQRLGQRYDLHPLWTEPDRARFLENSKGRFAGGVTMSRHGCPADIFSLLQGTVVACFGVGYEGLDLEAAKHHDVQVSTTPNVLNDCVADCAFALVLSVARRIVAADRFVQKGRWPTEAFGLGTRVSGKKLGIVGLGRIGRAIALRAGGFGMDVRYHGPRPRPDAPYPFEPDLISLANWADFLVVACPGGDRTRNLVSADVLRALGAEGYLINIARGSIVDEEALVQAIVNQSIAGAGLDVYRHEPHVPPQLLDNDRVVLLPHIAAGTRETRAEMEKLVEDNLESFFRSGKVLTPPG